MSLSLENVTSAYHTAIEGECRRRRTLAAAVVAAFDTLCNWTERTLPG